MAPHCSKMTIAVCGLAPMKMVAEYLEKALDFERMAAAENDPDLKISLMQQAEAYRKLAAQRAVRETPLRPASGE
jgi:hypothetical protein